VAVERTLVLVKPDAVKRGLAGEILARFERRGLEIREARLVQVDRELAERHYAEHAEKPFFGELVEFITSAPTLALVLEGESAI
jgi:nucleoside-diphosphate kinase